MKLLTTLIALAISLPSHANVVTRKDLKSCINNCIAVHSCNAKPMKKGKKHAKKIQKKRATASVKPVQKEEAKACEKVTEYIFLPAFEEASRLPYNDYQMQRDTPTEARTERGARENQRENGWIYGNWNYGIALSNIFAYELIHGEANGVSNTIKLPERGIPINAPIPTPLPASVFLFASGLAIIVRRSKQ